MEKYCDTLEKIKENSEENYQNLLKVLSYIHKSCEVNMEATFIKESSAKSYLTPILMDMCTNADQRFAQKFFEKTSIPIDLITNKLMLETAPYLYLYNIFTILKAYETNKNNYEKFRDITEDIAYIFPIFYYKQANTTESNINSKLGLIEEIVQNKYYQKNNPLSDLLKKTLMYLNTEWEEKEYERLNEMFRLCRNLDHDITNLKHKGCEIKDSVQTSILDDILLLTNDDLLPGCEPFYESIMLQKNRYHDIQKALQHIPYYHRQELFNTYLTTLDPDLFAELNIGKETDSFTTYLEIIFDSDTYHELISKLTDFNRASDCYRNGDKQMAYKLLTELSSNKHKEEIDGVIITYPTDQINQITKPETIPKRMLELYHRYGLLGLYYQFDKEKVEEIFGEQTKALTISEFNEKVTSELMRHKTNDTNKNLFEEETSSVNKKKRFNFHR